MITFHDELGIRIFSELIESFLLKKNNFAARWILTKSLRCDGINLCSNETGELVKMHLIAITFCIAFKKKKTSNKQAKNHLQVANFELNV